MEQKEVGEAVLLCHDDCHAIDHGRPDLEASEVAAMLGMRSDQSCPRRV
jgi:hypothetical protein